MHSLKVYAQVRGAKGSEAALFIPGFVGSHEVWDEHFLSLSDEYRLILIDVLGFGRSPKPDLAYTVEDHLTAISNTLRELNVGRLHIVGYSMGSLMAVAYAYHYPESVISLVLLATPWFENESQARETISNHSLFNRMLALDTPLAHFACSLMCHLRPLLMPLMPLLVREVPAVVAKEGLRHTWTSYSRTLRNVIFRSETRRWMQSIRQPVLMLHGEHDRTAPIENVRKGIAALPQIRLIEYDADHSLIFAHSAALASEIREFFHSQPAT
jgi:pimeloyl-ACP methyl ester carboxylesterase